MGDHLRNALGPWRRLKGAWERFLGWLPPWLSPWVRDLVDVGATVGVIIVVLRLLLGADMLVPLVVVTSESMIHQPDDLSWKLWMRERGLSDKAIESFPLISGFNMGDMILVRDPKAGLGDVVIYERDLDHLTFMTKDPIIHRVVGVAHVGNYKVVDVEGTLDCLSPPTLEPTIKMIMECQTKKTYCPYTRYPNGGDFNILITKGDNNEGSDQCNKKLNIAYPVNEAQVTGCAYIRLPYLGWPKLLLNIIYRILTLQF